MRRSVVWKHDWQAITPLSWYIILNPNGIGNAAWTAKARSKGGATLCVSRFIKASDALRSRSWLFVFVACTRWNGGGGVCCVYSSLATTMNAHYHWKPKMAAVHHRKWICRQPWACRPPPPTFKLIIASSFSSSPVLLFLNNSFFLLLDRHIFFTKSVKTDEPTASPDSSGFISIFAGCCF